MLSLKKTRRIDLWRKQRQLALLPLVIVLVPLKMTEVPHRKAFFQGENALVPLSFQLN